MGVSGQPIGPISKCKESKNYHYTLCDSPAKRSSQSSSRLTPKITHHADFAKCFHLFIIPAFGSGVVGSVLISVYANSDVLKTVSRKIFVLSNIVSCSVIEIYKRFGITYCLNLQGTNLPKYTTSHLRTRHLRFWTSWLAFALNIPIKDTHECNKGRIHSLWSV
jgi:hypothetical protein